MKILCVADTETRELWDHWDGVGRSRTEGVQLILSAGDISPEYLEFLVTMMGVPCLYIRGNHDGRYDEEPPLGCMCIEDRIVDIYEDPVTGYAVPEENGAASKLRRMLRAGIPGEAGSRDSDAGEAGQAGRGPAVRIAGLGGSMRYHEGPDMYTEQEMAKRVRKLRRRLGSGLTKRGPAAQGAGDGSGGTPVKILLTHAPSLGNGDLEDLPHRGFDCFNELIRQWRPDFHLFGHVHMEYAAVTRETIHPEGTRLINVSGMYILEI